MGLALEALRQGDTADFMVLAGGELSLDAWIDVLQIRPLLPGNSWILRG